MYSVQSAGSTLPESLVLFWFWKHVTTTCYLPVQQNLCKLTVGDPFQTFSLFTSHTYNLWTKYARQGQFMSITFGITIQKWIGSVQKMSNGDTLTQYLQFCVSILQFKILRCCWGLLWIVFGISMALKMLTWLLGTEDSGNGWASPFVQTQVLPICFIHSI